MDETQGRVDDVRTASSELENHLIDEYSAGKITRREFVRRGTVVGMSLPLLSFLATACGGDGDGGATTAAGETAGQARRGGDRKKHTSELQSRQYLVCRLLLEKKKKKKKI